MVFRNVWAWVSSTRKSNLSLTPTSTSSSASSQESTRSGCGGQGQQAATTTAYMVCPRPLPSRAYSDGTDTECPICLEDMELVIFASKPPGKRRSLRRRQCHKAVEVPPVDAALHASKGHVVSPCGHVYHFKCLKGWLEVKSLCPICQDTLPTLSLTHYD
ncbi:hypothetical protein IAR50_002416 [Cryptococcus sp. DSM 104548]